MADAAIQIALQAHPFLIFLIVIAAIWSLVWKGLALWKAAKKNSPVWFVFLLIINTLGILEILYIGWFSEMNSNSAVKSARSRKK